MKTGSNKDVLMKTTFKRLLMIQILSSFSAFIGPLIDGIIVSDFMGPEYMTREGARNACKRVPAKGKYISILAAYEGMSEDDLHAEYLGA